MMLSNEAIWYSALRPSVAAIASVELDLPADGLAGGVLELVGRVGGVGAHEEHSGLGDGVGQQRRCLLVDADVGRCRRFGGRAAAARVVDTTGEQEGCRGGERGGDEQASRLHWDTSVVAVRRSTGSLDRAASPTRAYPQPEAPSRPRGAPDSPVRRLRPHPSRSIEWTNRGQLLRTPQDLGRRSHHRARSSRHGSHRACSRSRSCCTSSSRRAPTAPPASCSPPRRSGRPSPGP